MCVIAYQTCNDDLLTFSEVKAMEKTNSDGMGWMALIDGVVHYKKGYFDVLEFYKDYLKLRKENKCTEIALHFRIGTGSAIDQYNCHPFPISSDLSQIQSLEGISDVCIMMNGVIGRSTDKLSDTAIYTMKNLKSYYDFDNRFWINFDKRDLMLFENEIYGNRFIFMSAEGSRLFGDGWTTYKGKCDVSNEHWLRNLNFGFSYSNPNRKYKSYIDLLIEGAI